MEAGSSHFGLPQDHSPALSLDIIALRQLVDQVQVHPWLLIAYPLEIL
jgi:hypothetical protein